MIARAVVEVKELDVLVPGPGGGGGVGGGVGGGGVLGGFWGGGGGVVGDAAIRRALEPAIITAICDSILRVSQLPRIMKAKQTPITQQTLDFLRIAASRGWEILQSANRAPALGVQGKENQQKKKRCRMLARLRTKTRSV